MCTYLQAYNSIQILDYSNQYMKISIPYSAIFGWRKTLANLVNHWWFPEFYCPMSCDINNESKQMGTCWSFTCQKFVMGNFPTFSSVKHSCYTVSCLLHEAACFCVIVTTYWHLLLVSWWEKWIIMVQWLEGSVIK